MKRLSALLLLVVGCLLLSGCSSKEQRKARQLAKAARMEQQKNYKEAILNYRAALSDDPQDAQVCYKLSLAYIENKQYRDAIQQLNRALTINKDYTEARVKLASLLSSMGDAKDVEKAKKLAEEAVAAKPDSVEAQEVLAYSELRLGQVPDATHQLEKIMRNAPKRVQSAVMLSSLKLRSGDTAGAEAVLKEAAAADPSSADAYIALGRFYAATRRNAEAEQAFQTAVHNKPDYAPALLSLGPVQVQAGRKSEAEATYLRLSKLPGGDYKGIYGAYLASTQQNDRAIQEFSRLVKEFPKDDDIREQLLSVYIQSGKRKEAEDLINAAVEKDDKAIGPLMQRARLYLQYGQPEKAEADARKVVDLKGNLPEAHNLLAASYGARGLVPKQISEMRTSLKINPGVLQTRIALASLLLKSGRLTEAMDVLDKAPASQQKSPQLIGQKNWVAIRMNDKWNLVETQVSEALKGMPTPEIILQDVILQVHKKNYDRAQAQLDKLRGQNVNGVNLLEAQFAVTAARSGADKALQQMSQAIRSQPSAGALEFLAGYLSRYGKPEEATQALLEAKRLDPQQPGIDLSLANIDIQQHKFDAAEQKLNAMIASNTLPVRAEQMLADLKLGTGNTARAVELYRKVLAAEPFNFLALNNLSYLLALEPAHVDEAGELADRAREITPDEPSVLDTLGLVNYQRKQYSAARRLFEQAVAKQSNPTRRAHLAMARMMTGERDAAVEELQQIKGSNQIAGPEIALVNEALGVRPVKQTP